MNQNPTNKIDTGSELKKLWLTRPNCIDILDSRSSNKRRTNPAASAFWPEIYFSVIPCIDMQRRGSILYAQSTTA